MKNREFALILWFDIRGYFEISVFEISRVHCTCFVISYIFPFGVMGRMLIQTGLVAEHYSHFKVYCKRILSFLKNNALCER